MPPTPRRSTTEKTEEPQAAALLPDLQASTLRDVSEDWKAHVRSVGVPSRWTLWALLREAESLMIRSSAVRSISGWVILPGDVDTVTLVEACRDPESARGIVWSAVGSVRSPLPPA